MIGALIGLMIALAWGAHVGGIPVGLALLGIIASGVAIISLVEPL